MKMIVQQMKMPTLMLMVVILMRIALLLIMNLLLTLLFRMTAHGKNRGYDSLNGIVKIIQNYVGNCIDFHVLSKKSTLPVQVGRSDRGN